MASRAELRAQTAERVVDAADAAFRRDGYEATKIRDIADAAGVSVGTVMSVGDKRALLVLGFDRIIAAEHAAQAALPEPSDRASTTELVMAALTPFAAMFARHPDLGRTYIATLLSGSHASRLFTELSEMLTTQLADILRSRRHPDPTAGARAIYFAYVGALLVYAGRGDLELGEYLDDLAGAIQQICHEGPTDPPVAER